MYWKGFLPRKRFRIKNFDNQENIDIRKETKNWSRDQWNYFWKKIRRVAPGSHRPSHVKQILKEIQQMTRKSTSKNNFHAEPNQQTLSRMMNRNKHTTKKKFHWPWHPKRPSGTKTRFWHSMETYKTKKHAKTKSQAPTMLQSHSSKTTSPQQSIPQTMHEHKKSYVFKKMNMFKVPFPKRLMPNPKAARATSRMWFPASSNFLSWASELNGEVMSAILDFNNPKSIDPIKMVTNAFRVMLLGIDSILKKLISEMTDKNCQTQTRILQSYKNRASHIDIEPYLKHLLSLPTMPDFEVFTSPWQHPLQIDDVFKTIMTNILTNDRCRVILFNMRKCYIEVFEGGANHSVQWIYVDETVPWSCYCMQNIIQDSQVGSLPRCKMIIPGFCGTDAEMHTTHFEKLIMGHIETRFQKDVIHVNKFTQMHCTKNINNLNLVSSDFIWIAYDQLASSILKTTNSTSFKADHETIFMRAWKVAVYYMRKHLPKDDKTITLDSVQALLNLKISVTQKHLHSFNPPFETTSKSLNNISMDLSHSVYNMTKLLFAASQNGIFICWITSKHALDSKSSTNSQNKNNKLHFPWLYVEIASHESIDIHLFKTNTNT